MINGLCFSFLFFFFLRETYTVFLELGREYLIRIGMQSFFSFYLHFLKKIFRWQV